jgi:dephospho-CoA kinase
LALVLGVTGGIATGKSTVLKMLSDLGALTLSADTIAHEVLAKDTPAYRQVFERFGSEVLGPDGEVDRSALAAVIFTDPVAREDLNAITHPHIIRRVREHIDSFRRSPPSPDSVLAIEIPLLMECGLESMVDQVLVVAAEQETQVGRLTSRSGISPQEALRRIQTQMPVSQKVERADIVIWNDGDLDELEGSVKDLWEEIKSLQR